MAVKFIKLRCKRYDINGDKVSENEYSMYPGDFLNIKVPVLDQATGLESNFVVAVISLVEGEGAIRDDLDSVLEEIIPEDGEWDMDDAEA